MAVTAAVSVEDFERNVVSALRVQLQSALDATSARYLPYDQDDGLIDIDGTSLVAQEMTPPADDSYYPGGLDVVARFPSIEVAVPDFGLTQYTIGGEDALGQVTLVVQVHLQDARFQVLNRLLKRYTAAVYDVLRGDGVLGDASIMETQFRWRTNPEMPDQNDRIAAGGLIFLTLQTAQVRV